MKKTLLLGAASLLLLASPTTPAAIFTDWLGFDPGSGTASGTLGSTSVTLTGADIQLVFTNPSVADFSTGDFTPPEPLSEAVLLITATTYAVNFGSSVTDPVIHLSGLFSTLTFSAGSITRLSGTAGLTVVGNQVIGSVNDGGSGTIQLNGSFTTFTFSGDSPSLISLQIGGTVAGGGCTLVCPTDIVVNNSPGLCGATGVALGEPIVEGSCTVATLGNNAPATFPKGTTTVTWTLTDTDGNTTTCEQSVTVKDAEKPVLTCPANVVAHTAPGTCSGVVTPATLGSPTVAENCPGFVQVFGERSDGQPLNSAYPGGMTVVTWTATDPAGNIGTCLQTVTVEDHEAPQFTCPPNTTVPDLASVPPPVNTAVDNCDDNPTVSSVDAVSGTCALVLIRTYTVTDDAGNPTTCQQTFTVNDGVSSSNDILWLQPLARNGSSDDTDPSAGGTVKYRFKLGSTIPIQINVQGCSGDVTGNANIIGNVDVFGDSNCDGAADGNELPIDQNGVGGASGLMDKVGGKLKFNLNTKLLPNTVQCYVLRVTVTDTSTGQERIENVLLQAK